MRLQNAAPTRNTLMRGEFHFSAASTTGPSPGPKSPASIFSADERAGSGVSPSALPTDGRGGSEGLPERTPVRSPEDGPARLGSSMTQVLETADMLEGPIIDRKIPIEG